MGLGQSGYVPITSFEPQIPAPGPDVIPGGSNDQGDVFGTFTLQYPNFPAAGDPNMRVMFSVMDFENGDKLRMKALGYCETGKTLGKDQYQLISTDSTGAVFNFKTDVVGKANGDALLLVNADANSAAYTVAIQQIELIAPSA